MKDGLGQEIVPGAQVVWVSGKGNYAGVIVYEIEKLTEKRVKLVSVEEWSGPGSATYVHPGDLVVVDSLLPTKQCEDEE